MTNHIVDHNKMAQLPRKLTAENGAKALLIGEFFETGSYLPVSWTTIKAIYAKIVEHFATPATWHPIDPADESTLPGIDDADEDGNVHVRYRDGETSLRHWSACGRSPAIQHWAPRIKQVPPKWEE